MRGPDPGQQAATHTAPWPLSPSAICPWSPQHRGLQRPKVTHGGTKKTARIAENSQLAGRFRRWWHVVDSNHRRRSRRFYRPIPRPDGRCPPYVRIRRNRRARISTRLWHHEPSPPLPGETADRNRRLGRVEALLPSLQHPADRSLTENDHGRGCSVVARMSRYGPVAAGTNRHQIRGS